jgi:predicted RNA-binding protein with PIN domain
VGYDNHRRRAGRCADRVTTLDGVTLPAHPPLLPEGVRRHLSELAAAVLGDLDAQDVPASLQKVRAFAPARRARAGIGPLSVALDRDTAFRQHVAAAWRALHEDLGAAIDAGSIPAATDPAPALSGVYLLRPPRWEGMIDTLATAVEQVGAHVAVAQSEAALRAELKTAREEADRLREVLSREQTRIVALEEELAAARRETRKQRSDADRARAQIRDVLAEVAAERERLQEQARTQQEASREAAERVQQAAERLEHSRRAEREGRSLADARLRLLLDTVVEAASGLRRELALPPADLHPADLVTPAPAGPGAMPGVVAPSGHGRPPQDPGLLVQLLALPQVHLIVDGYNVTKSGYGSLPLSEQRRRLLHGLTALAARTGAEVTCCFDGAEVDAAGAWRSRGVRVLFSQAGTTADDLVRRLVRAEPQGRPVVVVSTDGEVARGARSAGAHPVPSEALLRLLARG